MKNKLDGLEPSTFDWRRFEEFVDSGEAYKCIVMENSLFDVRRDKIKRDKYLKEYGYLKSINKQMEKCEEVLESECYDLKD